MKKPLCSMLCLSLISLAITLSVVPEVAGPGSAFAGESGFFTAKVPAPSPYFREQDSALAAGKFLVASREMGDPRFAETVIFLVNYSSEGAMGLVINRPTSAKLSGAFPEMEKLKKRTDVIYVGGPVRVEQMFMLVRASGKPEDSRHVFADVYVSGSRALLRRLVDQGESGKKFRVFAGHAGWSPGQLDREVAMGGWYVVAADADTIFEKDSFRVWPELIRKGSLKWIDWKDVSTPPRPVAEPF
jgi:putative transcriptional regulator